MRAPASVLDEAAWQQPYDALPPGGSSRVAPTPVREPCWIRINAPLAASLGLDPDALGDSQTLAALAGNRSPAGTEPQALAYAGHQFGHFVPQLGDGRAIVLGALPDREGTLHDIQLKGCGRTPYSRGGDGRAPIGPVVREYLASEAMAALGIPTTRSLAAVATGETVTRFQPEPGAVLTRTARSHIRVGTFEYFHRRGDTAGVRQLVAHFLARNAPDLRRSERPAAALLERVVDQTAELIADWMAVGFIHGVMNTDNLSLAGETIDYGPFGFLDTYAPQTVYSAIDVYGRYAYDRQPAIAEWNLARLAEALLPLLHHDMDIALAEAHDALDRFQARYDAAYQRRLRAKLGLRQAADDDTALISRLLTLLQQESVDWTLFFRRLCVLPGTHPRDDTPVRRLFDDPGAFDAWAEGWRHRLGQEMRCDEERQAAMRATNPAYILRNHLAQWAVDAATQRFDFHPMERLLTVLQDPYEDHPGHEDLAQPPGPGQQVTRTFCGT